NYFVEVAHHHESPTADEFRANVEKYEDFLLQYVFSPQYRAYEQVDAVLGAGVDAIGANELRSLITRNIETYSYFFRNADESWIEKLESESFLVADHEVSGYLARIVERKPKEVFAVLGKLKLEEADWISVGKLVEAASHLPPRMMSSFTDLIISSGWLKSPQAEMNSHSVVTFLEALLSHGIYKKALSLADEILDVRQLGPDATANVKEYQYEQALEELRKIPVHEMAPFIRLVVQKLHSVMLIEHPRRNTEDTSYIWHPAVEDHGQNWNRDGVGSLLIVAIRDMLQTYFSGKKQAGKTGWQTELPELLKTEIAFAIFDRIKIHMYRIFKEDFGDAIESVLFAKLGDTYVWHEYALLADESFPQFDSITRGKYLAAIEKGPGDKGRDAQYKKYWITRQLKLIRNHLTADEKKRFVKFDIFEDGEFDNDPSFISATRSFHGPTSAYTKADLEKLSALECVQTLIAWKPDSGYFAPSREGLGRIFQEIVKNSKEDNSRYRLFF
ncbi:hypothetical protein EBT25_14365, partial [bacterium]|nr:hypothetical protein [bacterium]